jgi:hypothetical protein
MQRPDTVLLNQSGSDPFPFIKNAWNMFSKKGKKTIFISIGSSKSVIADMEIAETIGCPLIIVPGSKAGLAGWIEVAECIKTHEPAVNPKSEFSRGADDKWILPKNLWIEAASMPGWRLATNTKADNYCVEEIPFYDWVKQRCEKIGLTKDETRIDILKIDLQDGSERSLLYAMLDAGFRPSLITVNWSASPDTDLSTLLTAGHLQNSGYVLIRKESTKFLYYFVDSDMYTICSWENTNVVNPMVDELVNQVRSTLQPDPILTEEGHPPLVTESLNH